jgi:hypothetical protein
MRENLVTLGLAFFITCTGVLFWKNRALVKEYEQGQLRLQSVLNNVQQSNPTWMSTALLSLPEKSVLILCSDSIGCNACLMAETADWQQWLTQDTHRTAAMIKLICTSSRPARLKREFESAGIGYEIIIDSTGVLSEALHVTKSPEVFFCYKGHVMHRYIADINDRDRTRIMQEKFAAFLNLK